MNELKGKVALVTGAGRRVGAAIARALAAKGMRLALHYHSSSAGAEEIRDELHAAGGEAALFRADLNDFDAARRLVDEVLKFFGRLDVLVPSAANFPRIALEAVDEAAWAEPMRLNLESPFFLVQRAIPALRESRGAVVFITCSTTATPYVGYLPYVISKAGLRQLMRVLTLELAPHIRVNAVAPGTVLPPEDMPQAEVDAFVRDIPLARLGSAEAVAEAVVYLAEADFVNGQELIVDGGRSVAALPAAASRGV